MQDLPSFASIGVARQASVAISWPSLMQKMTGLSALGAVHQKPTQSERKDSSSLGKQPSKALGERRPESARAARERFENRKTVNETEARDRHHRQRRLLVS